MVGRAEDAQGGIVAVSIDDSGIGVMPTNLIQLLWELAVVVLCRLVQPIDASNILVVFFPWRALKNCKTCWDKSNWEVS